MPAPPRSPSRCATASMLGRASRPARAARAPPTVSAPLACADLDGALRRSRARAPGRRASRYASASSRQQHPLDGAERRRAPILARSALRASRCPRRRGRSRRRRTRGWPGRGARGTGCRRARRAPCAAWAWASGQRHLAASIRAARQANCRATQRASSEPCLVGQADRAFEVGRALPPPAHERQRDAALAQAERLAPQSDRDLLAERGVVQLRQRLLDVRQRVAQSAGPEGRLRLVHQHAELHGRVVDVARQGVGLAQIALRVGAVAGEEQQLAEGREQPRQRRPVAGCARRARGPRRRALGLVARSARRCVPARSRSSYVCSARATAAADSGARRAAPARGAVAPALRACRCP